MALLTTSRGCGARRWTDVDVIICYCPADARWLPEAVESIQRQQVVRVHLHLINDGVLLVDDPAGEYRLTPNVSRYRNRDAPVGPYVSANRVFRFLRSDFFAIQDADDRSIAHRLRTQLEVMRGRPKYDICAGNMVNFVNPGETNPNILRRLRGQLLLRGNQRWSTNPSGSLINGTMMVRRCAFERINGFADWKCAADNEFQERAHHSRLRVIHLDEVLGERRLHDGSMTHARWFGDEQRRRQETIAECLRRLQIYESGPFDPREFGALDRADPTQLEIVR